MDSVDSCTGWTLFSGERPPWHDVVVNSFNDGFHLTMGGGPHAEREAALIWARATALRDGRPDPLTGEEKIPGIQRRLDLKGSTLLLAGRHNSRTGFALFAPQAEILEIFYLAVAPPAWGQGVAGRLLVAAEDHAQSIGCAALELWVINDNRRALGVYTRSGFAATDQIKIDQSSGQIERRMRKHIK